MLTVNYGCSLALSVGCGFGVSYMIMKLSGMLDRKYEDREYKLTLVARKDAKVPSNKIAVLCTHAAEMANEHLKAIDPTFYEECQIFRQPKVVLKADQNSLMVAEKKARELGLQVTGVTGNDGTTLILAVGPGPVDMVNEATSELKLY